MTCPGSANSHFSLITMVTVFSSCLQTEEHPQLRQWGRMENLTKQTRGSGRKRAVIMAEHFPALRFGNVFVSRDREAVCGGAVNSHKHALRDGRAGSGRHHRGAVFDSRSHAQSRTRGQIPSKVSSCLDNLQFALCREKSANVSTRTVNTDNFSASPRLLNETHAMLKLALKETQGSYGSVKAG